MEVTFQLIRDGTNFLDDSRFPNSMSDIVGQSRHISDLSLRDDRGQAPRMNRFVAVLEVISYQCHRVDANATEALSARMGQLVRGVTSG